MRIEQVEKNNEHEFLDFLGLRAESSLFMLSNFNDYGATMTDHYNSGNFRLLKENETIKASWCLCRRGNVLVQSDRKADYASVIFEDIKNESVRPTGVIGPYDIAVPIWKLLEQNDSKLKRMMFSKEVLYSNDLSLLGDDKPSLIRGARFLNIKDFKQWDKLNEEYLREVGIGLPTDKNIRKNLFIEKVKKNQVWGVFVDDRLVSIGEFNAMVEDLAQIGGVFTSFDQRRMGFSKLCMEQLIFDSVHHHLLKKLILFTGENNFAAQKLYEKIGFNKIGDFGLLLGT